MLPQAILPVAAFLFCHIGKYVYLCIRKPQDNGLPRKKHFSPYSFRSETGHFTLCYKE